MAYHGLIPGPGLWPPFLLYLAPLVILVHCSSVMLHSLVVLHTSRRFPSEYLHTYQSSALSRILPPEFTVVPAQVSLPL